MAWKSIKIKATFKGTNGSLGYVNGKEYDLIITRNATIKREDGTGVCDYESLVSFLENWTNIIHD